MRCQESDRGTVLWNGVGTKGSGSSPASDDAGRAQKAGRRGKAPCCVAASSVEEGVSTWRKCGQVRKAKDPAPTSRKPGPRQETLGRGAIPPPFIETTTQESGLRDTEGAAKQKLHEPFERAGGGRAEAPPLPTLHQ